MYICVSCWVKKILRQDNQSQISLDELLLELLPLEDDVDGVLELFDSLVALKINKYNCKFLIFLKGYEKLNFLYVKVSYMYVIRLNISNAIFKLKCMLSIDKIVNIPEESD